MHIYGICLFLWKANVIGYLVDFVFVHAHDYVYRGHLYFILRKEEREAIADDNEATIQTVFIAGV